jgi:TPR repeat protein
MSRLVLPAAIGLALIATIPALAQPQSAWTQTMTALTYQDESGPMAMPERAAAWFRKAADQGFAPAQAALGELYLKGEGVPRDDEEAFKWLSRAAAQGRPEAQVQAGRMYAEGRGVAANARAAARLFKAAARQGDDEGQRLLAVAYAEGSGVRRSEAKAVALLRAAADKGNAQAEVNLVRLQASLALVSIEPVAPRSARN